MTLCRDGCGREATYKGRCAECRRERQRLYRQRYRAQRRAVQALGVCEGAAMRPCLTQGLHSHCLSCGIVTEEGRHECEECIRWKELRAAQEHSRAEQDEVRRHELFLKIDRLSRAVERDERLGVA